MTTIAMATDGAVIDLDSLPSTYSYNADGTVAYVQVTHPIGGVYRQTMTYTAGLVTAISAWVKQ